jgi:DNA modification methylase
MQSQKADFEMLVEWRNRTELKPDPKNSKIHPPKQIEQVARSIGEFGWTNPILIDELDGVIAGHARLLAAEKRGMTKVPTIRLAHMSPAQKRAYMIADNKLAENAKWDRKLLALEHEAIQLLDPDFDLTLSGFELDEIEVLFDNEIESRQDSIPPVNIKDPPVSRVGDLWQLGEHLLLCGDALRAESFDVLMDEERAQLVITDPPYNVRVAGNVSSSDRHGEFVMASGEMSSSEFTEFLTAAFANLIRFSCDGSIHFHFMDWRHLAEILAAGAQYAELKNVICWDKQTAGMGTFYRSQHELIFAFKNGSKPHINNFKLGQNGRHRSNVWSHPGLNGWVRDRKAQLSLHPTPKPVPLLAEAIKDCSKPNGIVVDCFAGSGSTLIAAQHTGRRARLIELDPHYVDVILRRFTAETAQKAVLCDDGRCFDDIQKQGR